MHTANNIKTISLCHSILENTSHILLDAHKALDYDDFSNGGKETLDMIEIKYKDILRDIQGISYFVSDMEEGLTVDDENEVEETALMIEGIIKDDTSEIAAAAGL